MSDQAGPSVAAVQARQAELAIRHGAVSDADRALTEILRSAHAAMREGVRRLDAIADEIDHATMRRNELAIDTPMGAREFQKFLLAKQREIVAVVADARELGRAKTTALEGLRRQYVPEGG